MVARTLLLTLLVWLPTALMANQADTAAMTSMDSIDTLVFQNSDAALKATLKLEQQLKTQPASNATRLRFSLTKCNALSATGQTQAAIELGQMGDAQSKLLNLEQIRPYFLNCIAGAHRRQGNYKVALTLLDSATLLAKSHQQPHALVNSLYQRGTLDASLENLASAIEDIRLALDIYSDLQPKPSGWSTPPLELIYAAMARLLYSTDDFTQALRYTQLSLAHSDPKGMLYHEFQIDLARIYFALNKKIEGDVVLQEAQHTIVQSDFPPEYVAMSFSKIAAIEFAQGNYPEAAALAQQAMEIRKKLNNPTQAMRLSQLLAQIKFAQGDSHQAVQLMADAIKQGELLQQHSDLAFFFQILADHYAQEEKYQLAHDYLTKHNQAIFEKNQQLNHLRLAQHQARLRQKSSPQSHTEKLSQANIQKVESRLSRIYFLIFVLGVLLLAILVWQFTNRSNLRFLNHSLPFDGSMSINQKLELMLSRTKHANEPLAIILLETSRLNTAELPQVIERLKEKIRAQDICVQYGAEQVLLVLPLTSMSGAHNIATQICATIQAWQESKYGYQSIPKVVRCGVSTLQATDTLATLIERARAAQRKQLRAAQSHTD
ncbi:tetratricopeptide repeat protein [Shewanella gelidii]|uniref:GGDEF domain-containing protein n=1 Tax=Shewanella gelidii TaxID=1642821 RepID=A0A917JRF9_9GAMM|nr:tetratricopeptide repeat protein [Shewanella gelidii]MCL1098396.1 tetratricopeptide repeat protein [Shewanella gelidii]GGI83053.1 hypothetical protein GCM10009332_20420 [Shewanella gelidii]